MKKNINKSLLIYLITLLLFSFFFLYLKHLVSNDSTISEWLINYEGGFTKRGIIGQTAIIIARIFDFELRQIIYLFQVSACTVYFILLFNFLKNINHDRIFLLAIFTPIFILYPVAEIEVLARKEILVFSLYLIYLAVPKINYIKYFSFISFLTLSILIWEPVVFYLPIFLLIEIIENNIDRFNFDFFKLILKFLPGVFLGIFIALNPLSSDQHDLMSTVLKNEFGEICYMSCELLKSKSSLIDQFVPLGAYTFERVIRYILIILIGFWPIFLLLKNSILKTKEILFLKYFNNLLYPTLISLIPVIVLFAMGYDWGRWVNITCVFTSIFFFYLYRKKYIFLSKALNKNYIYKINKKIFITIFIIFCFGWNPKTTITGDVASFPGYRIPYKTLSFFIRGHL